MTESKRPVLRNSHDMMQELFDEINGFIEDQEKAVSLLPQPFLNSVNTHSNNIRATEIISKGPMDHGLIDSEQLGYLQVQPNMHTSKGINNQPINTDLLKHYHTTVALLPSSPNLDHGAILAFDILNSRSEPPSPLPIRAFIEDYHTKGACPPPLPPEHSYEDLDEDITGNNMVSQDEDYYDNRGSWTTTTMIEGFSPLISLGPTNYCDTDQQHKMAGYGDEPMLISDTLSYPSPHPVLDELSVPGSPFLTPAQRVGEPHIIVLRTSMARDVGSHADRINAYNNAYAHCIMARTDMSSWIKKHYTEYCPDSVMQNILRSGKPPKTRFNLFKRQSRIMDQSPKSNLTSSWNGNNASIPSVSLVSLEPSTKIPSQPPSIPKQNDITLPSPHLWSLPLDGAEKYSAMEAQNSDDGSLHHEHHQIPTSLALSMDEKRKSVSLKSPGQPISESLYALDLHDDATIASPNDLSWSNYEQPTPSNNTTTSHQRGSQAQSSSNSAYTYQRWNVLSKKPLHDLSTFGRRQHQRSESSRRHSESLSRQPSLVSRARPYRSSSNIDMRSFYSSRLTSTRGNRVIYRTRSYDKSVMMDTQRRYSSYQPDITSHYQLAGDSTPYLIPHSSAINTSNEYRHRIANSWITSGGRRATDHLSIPIARGNLLSRSTRGDAHTNQGDFFGYPAVNICRKKQSSIQHPPVIHASSKQHPTLRYNHELGDLYTSFYRIPKDILDHYLKEAHGDIYLAKGLWMDDIMARRT